MCQETGTHGFEAEAGGAIPSSTVTMLCVALAVLTGALLRNPAQSAESWSPPLSARIGIRPLQDQPAARKMLAKAERLGRLVVVVELDFTLAENLSTTAEAVQMQRLDAAQDAVIARAAIARRDEIWKFEIIPAFAAEVTHAELARLLADPAVARITENYPLQPMLKESTQIIHARNLWHEGLTGAGQTVAVLDSGIDPTHPMMTGKIVAEACYSAGGPYYEPLCPNGLTQQDGTGAAVNCPKNIFPCFHGTHVAAIAAGKSNLLRGVAPDATIIAIQVTSRGDSAAACAGGIVPCAVPLSANVLAGLNKVYTLRRQHNIAAVNLSLGQGVFQTSCETVDSQLRDAVGKLRRARIAVVAAAGNQGLPDRLIYPACLQEAVAVGATTEDDQVLGTCNYHIGLKMLAPGQNITSAIPRGSVLPPDTQCLSSGRYCTISGTSQAAPHVAGAFALLRQAKPETTVPEMLSALTCTGKPAFRAGMSRHRINVLKAERELVAADTAEHFDFNSPSELEAWTQVLGSWIVAGGQLTATAWPSSGTPRGEWVMASHRYCSSSFKVDVFIDGLNASSIPNTANGLLLASNISVDGPTVSATGLFFGHNQIGQVFVERFENHPLKGGASIGGNSPRPCLTTGGPSLVPPHGLRVITRGDGVYDFYIDLQFMCTVTERQLPPPSQIAVLALRPVGDPNHELSIRWVDIKPR